MFREERASSELSVLVAPQGFEPRSSESESLVLPLNEGAPFEKTHSPASRTRTHPLTDSTSVPAPLLPVNAAPPDASCSAALSWFRRQAALTSMPVQLLRTLALVAHPHCTRGTSRRAWRSRPRRPRPRHQPRRTPSTPASLSPSSMSSLRMRRATPSMV